MPKPLILSEEEFHAAVKAGKAPSDAHRRKNYIAEVKAIDEGKRAIDFVISTASVDRYGDTVAVDGWKLDNFIKNPVVLWAHDSSMLPVAKASYVRIEDGKLKARAEFMPKEISGFANAVYEATKAGFLNATSVGFMPLKYNYVDDPARRYGIDFVEQELLEFSIVPVPANAEALIEARAAGVDIEPFKAWAKDLVALDGTALISRKQLMAIEALPAEMRAAAKKVPSSAKGASGIYLRCANIAEKAIAGARIERLGFDPIAEGPVVAGTPALDAARRRMAVLRARQI